MTVTPPPLLLAAVRRGDEKKALQLLEAGCYGDVDAVDEKLRDGSALSWAASRGMVSVVRKLVQLNADLAARSATECTPLHAAADCGQARVMKVLLKAGADVRLTNVNGSTPAHLAAFRGNAECLRILLHAGSDVMARDDDGKTVYMYGMLNGDREVREIVQGVRNRPVYHDHFLQELPCTASPGSHQVIYSATPLLDSCPSLTLRPYDVYQRSVCTGHCPVHCPVQDHKESSDLSDSAISASHGQLKPHGAECAQWDEEGYIN